VPKIVEFYRRTQLVRAKKWNMASFNLAHPVAIFANKHCFWCHFVSATVLCGSMHAVCTSSSSSSRTSTAKPLRYVTKCDQTVHHRHRHRHRNRCQPFLARLRVLLHPRYMSSIAHRYFYRVCSDNGVKDFLVRLGSGHRWKHLTQFQLRCRNAYYGVVTTTSLFGLDFDSTLVRRPFDGVRLFGKGQRGHGDVTC